MLLINGQEVIIEYFPNKEILLGQELVRFVTEDKEVMQNITLRFEDNADFMSLLFINSWMKEEGYKKQRLLLPYMPYSRMDRKVARHLFSLKYIADFMNGLEFEEVVILEAHSNVSLELIERVRNVSYTKELMEKAMVDMCFDKEVDAVVFPDAGARKRYANLLTSDVRVLEGEKVRNFDTGEIVELTLLGDRSKPVRRVLIVDDLCSRGGTFMQIASVCKMMGVESCYLAVTHLEDNVYSGNVFNEVSQIYTTDALQPFLHQAHAHEKITVYPLPKKFQMTICEEEQQ